MSAVSTVVRSLQPVGLTTRWDWTGLDGLLCFRHPACSSLSASARGLSLVSSPAPAWFLGLGPFPSSIPCRERATGRLTVHGYKCTIPLYSPRRPSYTVYTPTSPYSRPHEPEHSLACILQKLHFQQISCPSQLLHPPRFARPQGLVYLTAQLASTVNVTPAAQPLPRVCPTHAQRERSHLRHHHTQPRIQQPQPSAPGGSHPIWHIWRLKFPSLPVNCQLSTAA